MLRFVQVPPALCGRTIPWASDAFAEASCETMGLSEGPPPPSSDGTAFPKATTSPNAVLRPRGGRRGGAAGRRARAGGWGGG